MKTAQQRRQGPSSSLPFESCSRSLRRHVHIYPSIPTTVLLCPHLGPHGFNFFEGTDSIILDDLFGWQFFQQISCVSMSLPGMSMELCKHRNKRLNWACDPATLGFF
jgi:hypothetical protein